MHPPSVKFAFDNEERRGIAVDSIISPGCVISGAEVRYSLIFPKHSDNVLFPHTRFRYSLGRQYCKALRITRAVIEEGCDIPEGMVIGEDIKKDSKLFYVSPQGIVLVTPDELGQRLHHVR